MRTLLIIVIVLSVGACDEAHHSNFYDLGATGFKHTGDACQPDGAASSECGYPPQFYCTPAGLCASACNADADCTDGAKCFGAAEGIVGECRVTAGSDGG